MSLFIAGEWQQVTFKGSFQLKQFCDSVNVIVLKMSVLKMIILKGTVRNSCGNVTIIIIGKPHKEPAL